MNLPQVMVLAGHPPTGRSIYCKKVSDLSWIEDSYHLYVCLPTHPIKSYAFHFWLIAYLVIEGFLSFQTSSIQILAKSQPQGLFMKLACATLNQDAVLCSGDVERIFYILPLVVENVKI